MRKSTIAALVILLAAGAAMLWMFRLYTGQFVVEIGHAKDLTHELQGQGAIAPQSPVKLARVQGAAKYVVHEAGLWGLLVEAQPSEQTWRKDPTAAAFARDLAGRLFGLYGADRPVDWVEFHLTLPDGSRYPSFAWARGPHGTAQPYAAPGGGSSPGGR